jgi:hypothetical protein
MCATDLAPLDLDLQEIAEDEQAPRPDQHAAAQQPGVAWGLADHDIALGDVEAAPAS